MPRRARFPSRADEAGLPRLPERAEQFVMSGSVNRNIPEGYLSLYRVGARIAARAGIGADSRVRVVYDPVLKQGRLETVAMGERGRALTREPAGSMLLVMVVRKPYSPAVAGSTQCRVREVAPGRVVFDYPESAHWGEAPPRRVRVGAWRSTRRAGSGT